MGSGETNIGPLLAFDSFEEEMFLAVPLAMPAADSNVFSRTKIVILRLILCIKKGILVLNSTLPGNFFLAVDRR